jgi:hypothetical protein
VIGGGGGPSICSRLISPADVPITNRALSIRTRLVGWPEIPSSVRDQSSARDETSYAVSIVTPPLACA